MRERQAARERRRAREFEAFVGGAGGRLLRAAVLLTGENGQTGETGKNSLTGAGPHEAAERLLTAALADTYACWDRLRGEDPYEHARQELAARFARSAQRYRRTHGALEQLAPRERLVLVLRLHEGIAEEQVAACLGLPTERVRVLCTRAVAVLRSRRTPSGVP
ncbi:sigma factor-like helix-turn-helix DNA-binding protein [Streptomyces sp. NPDC051162]|uniref:sigma factor-like helix-turn-helix DNA-binding protein n=1 Tax=Streptomyces sp. NPDC051162 TaxID=3154747 RepID=UPI003418CDAB